MTRHQPPGCTQEQVEALYQAHGPRVLAYLARRVTPAEDAADLLSDVMVITWRRRGSIPPSPQDVLWLFGVARNVLANHRRSASRRHATTEHLAHLLGRTPAATDPSHGVDAGLDLHRALAGLDDLDREILTLGAWEELTSAEIAIVVGLPAATVRSRRARARTRLRVHLDTADPPLSTIPRPMTQSTSMTASSPVQR